MAPWRVVAVRAERRHRCPASRAVSLADVDGTVRRLVVIDARGRRAVAGRCSAVAGYWLVRRSLRPLVEIERTAAAIAGGDLSRRVPELGAGAPRWAGSAAR